MLDFRLLVVNLDFFWAGGSSRDLSAFRQLLLSCAVCEFGFLKATERIQSTKSL